MASFIMEHIKQILISVLLNNYINDFYDFIWEIFLLTFYGLLNLGMYLITFHVLAKCIAYIFNK